MSRYGTPYQNATAIQRELETSIHQQNSGVAKAQMTRAWKELELLKREIRQANIEARARRPRIIAPVETKKESTWPTPPSPHHPTPH
jgi:hypothetical protein